MAITTYQPTIRAVPYGTHVPYDRGWDAWSRRNAPVAEPDTASGYFISHILDHSIDLWLTDITADFVVNGETAQSRMLREHFQRSFADVTLTLVGNVASTQEYNRLASFVRESHWRYLNGVGDNSPTAVHEPAITFGLHDQLPAGWDAQTRTAEQTQLDVSGGIDAQTSRGVKGRHRPWQVSGFIRSIQAGAVRHEVAPEFTIEFMVATSKLTPGTGIWSEREAHTPHLKTFLDLLNVAENIAQATGSGFIKDPVFHILGTPVIGPGAKHTVRLHAADPSDASLWSTVAAQAFIT